jgi:hypothetical protein
VTDKVEPLTERAEAQWREGVDKRWRADGEYSWEDGERTETMRRLFATLDAERAKLAEYRRAFDEAGVVNWMWKGEHEDNPKAALNDLLVHALDLERDELRKELAELRDLAERLGAALVAANKINIGYRLHKTPSEATFKAASDIPGAVKAFAEWGARGKP